MLTNENESVAELRDVAKSRSAVGLPMRYAPVVRLKHAEKRALTDLPEDLRRIVTPLAVLRTIRGRKRQDEETGEWIEGAPPTFSEHLSKQVNWLQAISPNKLGLFRFPTVFVDVAELQQHTSEDVLGALHSHIGTADWLTPVLRTGCDPRTAAAASQMHRQYGTGCALRVRAGDGTWPTVAEIVSLALSAGCRPTESVLFVDVQFVGRGKSPSIAPKLLSTLAAYSKYQWKGAFLLSGSWPKSIAVLPFGMTSLPRDDVYLWSLVASKSPIGFDFADYGIAYANEGDKDGFATDVPPYLKLALDGEWNVYRRRVKSQIPEMCRSAIADIPSIQDDVSSSDTWILQAAGGAHTDTAPATWTRVGWVRHVFHTASQVSGSG